MDLREITILLPCQSLEDFSLQRDAMDAEELLSAWSAPYHPAILAAAASMPKWTRAEDPPQDPSGSLVMVPRCCEMLLPDNWLDQAELAGACVIRNLRHRDEMVAAALDRLDGYPNDLDPQLVADFLALGFCHFQVELLTRQLRYMSNLDEVQFESDTLGAAEAAVKGHHDAARDRLRSAFDLLTEAREYFYPVETYLLDLTLVAPSTLGQSLREELASDAMTNLLVSGELIEQMARREPATLAALKEALEKGRAAIVGGQWSERPLPLLPPEAILQDFSRGLASYQRHLGQRPAIFGRRRFGLSPVLPQILQKLGFSGAFHFTLDDGRFPTGNQSRIRWEGFAGAVLEALARLPLDVSRPETFLQMPEKLGDAMDLDHAATAVLAHWPGRSTRWYGDLRRMAEYSPVLGRFTTVTDYFEQTDLSGQITRYAADQYRSPYLRQAVAGRQVDPISQWARYHGRRVWVDALETLGTMTDLISGVPSKRHRHKTLLEAVEDSVEADCGSDSTLDERLNEQLEESVRRFAQCLPRQAAPAEKGYLLANPWSFAQNVRADLWEPGQLPTGAGPVRPSTESADERHAARDVPAMGFAWMGSGRPPSSPPEPTPRKRWRRKKKEQPPMAEENLLRNELFEAAVDPITGAIQSINDYTTRGNRLAGQIALRMPASGRRDAFAEAGSDEDYSVMALDELSIESPGPVLGKIVTRGRLMDRQGRRLAGFRQILALERKSRVLEIRIDLDVDQLPGPDPWNSYYAARFAWGDATADLYRSVNLTSRRSESVQLEAPHFIDVRSPQVSTTILTGGLPYHRRFGLRKLDTLLITQGETARSFRLGIGVDLLYPVASAMDFLAPQAAYLETASPPSGSSGWLFHLDARNVLATHWETITGDGRVKGFRVRLLETEGRPTRLGLRSFRPIVSAQKVDFQHQSPTDLPIDGDRITIALAGGEWTEVEAAFTA